MTAVTDLGTLGGNVSYGADLNQAGQVVGSAETAAGFFHAFLWDNGTMIDLGTLGGSYSSAEGINDLGQVVGTAALPDDSEHAFLVNPQGGLWFQDRDLDGRNDFMIDLGVLSEIDDIAYSEATDINNAGQVVGMSSLDHGGSLILHHAFLWDAINGMTDLGVGVAVGINETGQVTGTGNDLYGTFLWDATGGMTALGAGPDYTNPAAISDAGQVVGYLWDSPTSTEQAFLWTPESPNGHTGSFTDLGMLDWSNGMVGWSGSATDINNAGQVVGSGLVTFAGIFDYWSEPRAFHWNAAGGMVDLQNQLLPGSGVILESAQAINDDGAIVVNGYSNNGGYRAFLLTPIPPGSPSIRIADASAVTEGNAGTAAATFTVTLSAASSQTVTVAYATGRPTDGNNYTATAGSDYQATSGTLTFAPGETSKTITVPVIGDRLVEPNENFWVNLSSPTNATIDDGRGVNTIMDDEPRISISDVTKAEGKKGQTTLFTFTVTLSVAYDQAVTMSYRTVNGTATTGNGDYVAKTGTLTFAPGETTKTITITVKGDSKREAEETFYLDLFGNSSNSLFTKIRGLGTILNDD